MNIHRRKLTFSAVLLLLAAGPAALMLAVGTVGAADLYLVAKPFTKAIPLDGQGGTTIVPLWGFAFDSDGDLATDGGETPTVPGPVLTVPPGDPALNIHLRNDLPEAVSIVIPGQPAVLEPVRLPDGRVKSFTRETPPGGTNTYSWNLRPGTYLYQSGSHPQVQVPMGLYGALKKDAAPGQAYPGPAFAYDNEILLLFSEIDPALAAAVSSGTYGSPPYTSTIDYTPRYFLINGEPFPAASPIQDHAIAAGERVLVRFLNAGLESHVPSFLDLYMAVVAEDGNPYPFSRQQYSVLLAAGKTADALFTAPGSGGRKALFDRKLHLTNATTSPGGMLAYLEIGSGGPQDLLGPATNSVSTAPNPTGGAAQVSLTANADDSAAGGSNIAGAEWWTGPDPGEGNGSPMAAADGAFDTPSEALTAQINVSLWPAGDVQLWVRSRDAAGNWGAAASTLLSVTAATDTVSITRLRYRADRQQLQVIATSSAPGGTVTLTAVASFGGTPQTLGNLRYRSNTNDYALTFRNVASRPDSVTVTSTGGGADTKLIPYP